VARIIHKKIAKIVSQTIDNELSESLISNQ
jgi:hypothetical protein